MSKMMRIGDRIAKKLEGLSKILGKSKQSILEQAIEIYAKEQFLKRTNEEYALLYQNAAIKKQDLEELKAWDGTLQDGLDDE